MKYGDPPVPKERSETRAKDLANTAARDSAEPIEYY
jgi:hypothetical protein